MNNKTTVDHINFWPEGEGHPDYRAVPEFLSMSKCEVSRMTGASPVSIRYDSSIPARLSNQLEVVASILNRVTTIFEGDLEKTKLWFHMPNPLLGETSPREMLCQGRSKQLSLFLSEAEQYSVGVLSPNVGGDNNR